MNKNAEPNAARHAVFAGFLGWTLNAFDFFVVVFLFDVLAKQFAVEKKQIVSSIFR
jgi:SHS family lactate transporter-like MFS transporter